MSRRPRPPEVLTSRARPWLGLARIFLCPGCRRAVAGQMLVNGRRVMMRGRAHADGCRYTVKGQPA